MWKKRRKQVPNWTTNRVTINGPQADLKRLWDECTSEDMLDFAKIIPYPEGFDHTLPSGSGDESYDLIHGDAREWQRYAAYQWMPEESRGSREAVIAEMAKRYAANQYTTLLRDTYPTYQSLADAYKRNIEVGGHKTWYEWCNQNWGTKWGAVDFNLETPPPFETGVLEMTFNTAWAEPLQIFEALHARYPTLRIKYVAEHEGDDLITGRTFHPEEENE